MIKNKRAQWMWLIMGLLAVLVFVVSWFIIGPALGGADTTIKTLQSCEGQKGKCKSSCAENEIAHYKVLGCGLKDTDANVYCCIPQ